MTIMDFGCGLMTRKCQKHLWLKFLLELKVSTVYIYNISICFFSSKFPYVPTFRYFKTSTNIIQESNIHEHLLQVWMVFSLNDHPRNVSRPGATGLERHLTRVASEAVWAAKRLATAGRVIFEEKKWRKIFLGLMYLMILM